MKELLSKGYAMGGSYYWGFDSSLIKHMVLVSYSEDLKDMILKDDVSSDLLLSN